MKIRKKVSYSPREGKTRHPSREGKEESPAPEWQSQVKNLLWSIDLARTIAFYTTNAVILRSNVGIYMQSLANTGNRRKNIKPYPQSKKE